MVSPKKSPFLTESLDKWGLNNLLVSLHGQTHVANPGSRKQVLETPGLKEAASNGRHSNKWIRGEGCGLTGKPGGPDKATNMRVLYFLFAVVGNQPTDYVVALPVVVPKSNHDSIRKKTRRLFRPMNPRRPTRLASQQKRAWATHPNTPTGSLTLFWVTSSMGSNKSIFFRIHLILIVPGASDGYMFI